MKYIKSNDYTYEDMWNDTQDILDKYYWDLKDIETWDDGGKAIFYSSRYGVEAEYTITYPNYISDCYIINVDRKVWLDEMERAIGQLNLIWNAIDNAME